jgi:hypothetical protein
VTVLSHSLWARRFEHDPTILGRTIQLDGEPYEVIGVRAENIPQAAISGIEWSRERTEFRVPFALEKDELSNWGDFDYDCIGRLKEHVTAAEAIAELDAVQAHIAASIPQRVDLEGSLTPLQEEVTRGYRLNGPWRICAS